MKETKEERHITEAKHEYNKISKRMAEKKGMNGSHWDNRVKLNSEIKQMEKKLIENIKR